MKNRKTRLDLRVTSEFKTALEIESNRRKKNGNTAWSISDILHIVLADYIVSKSLNWDIHENKEIILENFGIDKYGKKKI